MCTIDLKIFGVKKLLKAHTSMKLKCARFCYYDNFISREMVHVSSFHSVHSYAPNVYDNNMYEAQTCTSLYYTAGVLMSVQDDGTVEVLRRMNYLIQEGL